jgi:hypothetical protein
MKQVDESKQPDLWTWIVVGLIFSAVMVALYGPFVWGTLGGRNSGADISS